MNNSHGPGGDHTSGQVEDLLFPDPAGAEDAELAENRIEMIDPSSVNPCEELRKTEGRGFDALIDGLLNVGKLP